ncbi:virion core protein [Kurthia zopfii]|uniref:Membrane protease subunit (Stomatin/prohibitin family) n=1 Tax=Kurthia zopfii TaxID=1650 RepID=A0A2U3AAI2_9BACL|nr:SPFH domain-containing protein [Kurthia zopfii]PWI21546.1 virion core protein (lumpy skin disease virus) [Kurthia zopfii]TDR34974.1 membrane protease subunit (stomatin/prohibitin family) [Kurthia zopfii]STX09636.1 Putative virion core protein (lumpy skin disease virus) [Kurthia zopfii]VEI08238.1 Putative virion core protein (lumpy skin disease virus) [Kurthia zopfii]GEK31485.1 virion core protein [Kurthia zopfii]
MGLLKAGIGAMKGVLEDQWREYIYCEGLSKDILVVKGHKRTTKRGSNKGNDNIISNGSIIAVNEGQCMMIVEQGKVVDVCTEQGEYVYDMSTEPSIFYDDDLMGNLKDTFKEIGKRFTFGGEPAKDQRVYFFNTKEIVGNKYGTPAPIPFRVVDRNIGLDVDISIRCHGEYSYRIIDPLLFYTNVVGNVESEYNREEIDSQLKTELMTALQPAFAKISALGVRYSEVPGHTMELADALNTVLSAKWTESRGLAIGSIGVSSMKASEEDENMIKTLQKNAVMRDSSMAAAQLTGAQAEAMVKAAENENGSMGAFMGMNMAQNAGGANAGQLYQMANEQRANQAQQSANENTWTCSNGHDSTGKFCAECGEKKPERSLWTCSCGQENIGKFCAECGSKKPEKSTWTCTCGQENTGKFCAECGASATH